jgi:hypothetical protein
VDSGYYVSGFRPSSSILKENGVLETAYVSVLRQKVGETHRATSIKRELISETDLDQYFKGLVYVRDSANFHLKTNRGELSETSCSFRMLDDEKAPGVQ